MIDYETPTITVAWEEGDKRVVCGKYGKYYPQRYIVRSNGLDWQYEPAYKGYKTIAGAKRTFGPATMKPVHPVRVTKAEKARAARSAAKFEAGYRQTFTVWTPEA